MVKLINEKQSTRRCYGCNKLFTKEYRQNKYYFLNVVFHEECINLLEVCNLCEINEDCYKLGKGFMINCQHLIRMFKENKKITYKLEKG